MATGTATSPTTTPGSTGVVTAVAKRGPAASSPGTAPATTVPPAADGSPVAVGSAAAARAGGAPAFLANGTIPATQGSASHMHEDTTSEGKAGFDAFSYAGRVISIGQNLMSEVFR